MEDNQYFLMVRSSEKGNIYYFSKGYEHNDDVLVAGFKSRGAIPEHKLNMAASLINKRCIEFSKIPKLFTLLTFPYHIIELREGFYNWVKSDSFDLQHITNEDLEKIVESFKEDEVTENQLNAIVSHRNILRISEF
ncbi:hypothetical protein HY498_05910 [Candidatus Woesearchaeota archaeon]|nr:hypothetical protein [Candidatus Woesearchaeota archaeon]